MAHIPSRRRRTRSYISALGALPMALETLEPRTLFSAAASPVDLVAQANNAFAFDLFQQLDKTQGNVFFSPYSIATALEMTLQGANGETADQIISALHLPPDAVAKAGIQALYQLFQADPATAGYTLSTANRLWVNANFPLLDSYASGVQQMFGAAPQTVDFSDPDAAAGTINAWVSDQTHGKIPDLISPDALNNFTRLVLTNALYFKGDWASAFNADATSDAAFQVTPDQASTVRMMFQESDLGYESVPGPNGFQALDLPYQGNNLDMLVILPTDSTLDDFESTLTPALFSQISGNFQTTDVAVSLPKFSLSETYNLNTALGNLGIQDAFTRTADFSGISPTTDPLYISSVAQKSFIDVEETGSEAAAATESSISCCSMAYHMPTTPVVFNADHPFLFAIRDRSTNTILFMGRVTDPGYDSDSPAPAPPTPPGAPVYINDPVIILPTKLVLLEPVAAAPVDAPVAAPMDAPVTAPVSVAVKVRSAPAVFDSMLIQPDALVVDESAGTGDATGTGLLATGFAVVPVANGSPRGNSSAPLLPPQLAEASGVVEGAGDTSFTLDSPVAQTLDSAGYDPLHALSGTRP